MRTPSPKYALDYPRLDDDLWIIWSGNEHKWPDGRRETSYLTNNRQHVMKGFALYSMFASDAATFPTEAAARAWLEENEAKRPHPYGINVTTVRDMKIARGYTQDD